MVTELNTLSKEQAYHITKTPPQFGSLTPRWLTRFMEFKGLEAGTWRVMLQRVETHAFMDKPIP